MDILIVKTSALGDVIQTFPILQLLKAKFPQSRIDWVVEAEGASLVASHPYIDRTIVCQTKAWRKGLLSQATYKEIKTFRREIQERHYDLLIDLQGNIKSALLGAFATAKVKIGYGWKTAPEKLNCLFTTHRYNPLAGLSMRAEYLHLCQSYLDDFSEVTNSTVALTISTEEQQQTDRLITQLRSRNLPLLLVCAGSRWPNKQLSDNTLIHFLENIQRDVPHQLLLSWGSPAELSIAKNVQNHFKEAFILEKMPLPQLQRVMSLVDKIIAVDSLPLHLAASAGTPTFSIFGPSSAAKYAPQGDIHTHLQGSCPYGKQFQKRCSILRSCETGACMRNIDPHMLHTHFSNRTSDRKGNNLGSIKY